MKLQTLASNTKQALTVICSDFHICVSWQLDKREDFYAASVLVSRDPGLSENNGKLRRSELFSQMFRFRRQSGQQTSGHILL